MVDEKDPKQELWNTVGRIGLCDAKHPPGADHVCELPAWHPGQHAALLEVTPGGPRCAVWGKSPREEDPHLIPYARAQLAAAVDEAHNALHDEALRMLFDMARLSKVPRERVAANALARAHEALHRVGAGVERTGCGLPDAARDPELQQLVADWMARLDRELPCGHTFAELVSGAGTVTFCGACADVRTPGESRVAIIRVGRGKSNERVKEAVWQQVLGLLLRGSTQAAAFDVRIEVVDVPREEPAREQEG